MASISIQPVAVARSPPAHAVQTASGSGLGRVREESATAYNPREEDEVCARNIVEWCHSQVAVPADWKDKKSKPPWIIPDIDPRKRPSKDQVPDPRYWPSMKREYPNAVQASRGQDCLKPNHFHLAGKVVYFVHWQFFFGELVPVVTCPKCGKVDRVCNDGWTGVTDKIRRVCSADAPAFIYSKVYRCGKGKKPGEGCPGMSLLNDTFAFWALLLGCNNLCPSVLCPPLIRT